MRSVSPVRSRSPAVADSAISAAQAALKKRNLQLQEFKAKYDSMLEEHTKLEGQLADGAKVKKDMEAQMNAIKDEHNKTQVHSHNMNSDCERLKQQLSDTQNEKKTIDNKRAAVAADNDKLKADLDKIKGFNVELQRQKDNLDDENGDLTREIE